MKTILILLDGLGDRSFSRLGHQTPLQAAITPHLDQLASIGSNGLFHAGRPGQPFPSEMAHYLLWGYPFQKFPGRGLLEAVGHGVPFEDSDVLSLAHLAGVSCEKGIPLLKEKRPQMEKHHLDALFEALAPFERRGVQFQLHRTGPHDAILIMRGKASPFVSDSDTMWPGTPLAEVAPLEENLEPVEARRTAEALNLYLTHCHRVLEAHPVNQQRQAQGKQPANFLVTQRCGRRVFQKPFYRKWGMRGILMATGAVYKGLASELDMAFLEVKDGDDPGEDMKERARLALEDTTHDFIHIHTKVPDEAAHTGDPEKKQLAITALDRGLEEIVTAVAEREDLILAVTGDHSTASVPIPSIHSGEPVPVVVAGPRVRRDDVSAFDEMQAARGCLGFLRGKELLLMLLNYAGRTALVGHRLGGERRPYFPEDYPPFTLV